MTNLSRLTLILAILSAAAAAQAGDDGIHISAGRSTSFMWTQSDGLGFRWDIAGNGMISDGSNDAYDGGMQLEINGSGYASFSTGQINKDGTEVEIGPWRYQNLSVYRRIFVNRKAGYCRWIDIFQNKQAAAVNASIRYRFNMGTSSRRIYTTSGGAGLTKKDWGTVTAGSSSSSSRPAVVHVFATRAAKLKPRFQSNRSNDDLFYHVALKVPANKTVALCFFEAQRRPYESAVKFLKGFKPEKELRLIPSALRRIIVNMAGASLILGDIELARNEESDMLVLRNGDEMLGTITATEFRLRTEFGNVKIPASQLIGLISNSSQGDFVQAVLTGGQVVAGELTSKAVAFKLAGGTELKVPPAGLRQVSYRLSPEKPEEISAKHALVMLRSGARLAFEESNLTLEFLTPHGRLSLSAADLEFIQMDTPAGGLHRAVFRNKSSLAGLLTSEELSFKLTLGLALKLPRQRVSRLYFGNAPVKSEPSAAIKLRNSDVLYGRVTDEKWTIRSKLDDIQVACADIATCEFSPESLGQVKLTLRNGSKLGGALASDYINFKITPGPAMKIFVGQISSITSGAGGDNTPTPSSQNASTNPGAEDLDKAVKESAKQIAVLREQLARAEAMLKANPTDRNLASQVGELAKALDQTMAESAKLRKLQAVRRGN